MSTAKTLMQLLTVPQTAELLGVGGNQVLALIRAGKLRASNVGLGASKPRWRIDPEDVGRFLAARQAPAPVATRRPRRRRDDDVIEFFT
jgi:excisionase family DNA binding protein